MELEIEAGNVTALVGHTGAGKSTIANLAMRTYDVTKGEVLINGCDIRDLDLSELHAKIGYVAQEPFLFEGSIRDNLILASEDASEDDIINALRGASAIEFVKKLDQIKERFKKYKRWINWERKRNCYW